MKVYKLSFKQQVPVHLAEAWAFFSDPKNLKAITPPFMGFDIQSGADKEMYAGQVILYKVRPLFNVPITWVTEITHVEYQKYFVDEQRFGPYAFWHHQHHFTANAKGVEILDILHYKLPMGILGRLFSSMTKKKLNQIFTYREAAIRRIFGE
jgi:ligand-binding SRPBCC domain-containing protein